MKCHHKFDTLKMFDVEEDRMLVNIVNPTDDDNNDTWRRESAGLQKTRKVSDYVYPMDGRFPPGDGEDIQLHFANPIPANLPNEEAQGCVSYLADGW